MELGDCFEADDFGGDLEHVRCLLQGSGTLHTQKGHLDFMDEVVACEDLISAAWLESKGTYYIHRRNAIKISMCLHE